MPVLKWLAFFLGVVVIASAIVLKSEIHAFFLDGATDLTKLKPEDSTWLEVLADIMAVIGPTCVGIYFVYKTFQKWARKRRFDTIREARREQESEAAGGEPGVRPAGRLDGELLAEADSIATYLESLSKTIRGSQIEEHFVPLSAEAQKVSDTALADLVQSFELQQSGQRKSIQLSTAHEQFDRYVLLGEPGSGKTTCLKHLAMQLIDAHKADPANAPIPVFCSLAQWTNPHIKALEYIEEIVARLTGPRNWMRHHVSELLEGGRLVVLLDGLNEMPGRAPSPKDTKPKQLASQHERIAENFADGKLLPRSIDVRERSLRDLASSHGVKSRFIITCRTHEFRSSVAWARVYVLPMSDKQILRFLRRYLSDRGRRREVFELLRDNEPLRELARNPFYLRMITLTADVEFRTIRNRGQILNKLLSNVLKREKVGEAQREAFIRRLSRLAFQMIDEDMIGSQVDLNMISTLSDSERAIGIGTNILMERDGGVVFRHQLLQEFFSALALRDRHVRRSIKHLIRDEKWTEMLILFHDIAADRERSLARLSRLLRQRNGLTRWPTRPPLLMLLTVCAMVVYSFVTANLVIDLIVGGGLWLGIITGHPWGITAFLSLPILIYWGLPTFCYHRKGIVNSAYVLSHTATDEDTERVCGHLVKSFSRVGVLLRKNISETIIRLGDRATPVLLAHLEDKRPAVRRGCIETLGMMKEPRAIPPLIAILRYGEHGYFPHAITALSRFDDDQSRLEIARSLRTFDSQTNPLLVFLINPLLCGVFVNAFKDMRSGQTGTIIEWLSEQARKDNEVYICRVLAIGALGAIGRPEAMPALTEVALDGSDPMAKNAAGQLALLDSAEVVDSILNVIGVMEEGANKDAAVKALGRVTSPKAVPKLIELLDDSRWWVREAALKALGHIGDQGCVPEILTRLEKLSVRSGEVLATCLGRIGGAEAFQGLLRLARDDISDTRRAALKVMDIRYSDLSGPEFVSLLLEPGYADKLRVLELLAVAPPPGDEFRQALLKLRNAPDSAVARQAARIYRQLDYSLKDRLRITQSAQALNRFGARFARWTGFTQWNRLLKQVELTDENPGSLDVFTHGVKAQLLAKTDPDLGKKVQFIIAIYTVLFVIGIMMIGALPVILFRSMSGIGGLVIGYWPWALAALGVGVTLNIVNGRGDRRVIGKLSTLANVLLVIAVLGLAVRYLPGLAWDLVVAIYDAARWCGRMMWSHRWVVSPLIVVGIVCALLPDARRTALLIAQRLFSFTGIALLVAALVVGSVVFWYVLLGLVVLMIAIAIVVIRRNARARRKRLRQALYVANQQLPPAIPAVIEQPTDDAHHSPPRGDGPPDVTPAEGGSGTTG